MTQLLNILLLIGVVGLWLVYAYFEGTREAYYYHATNLLPSNQQPEVHILFTWQRSVVMIIAAVCLIKIGILSVILTVAGCVCLFSYIHDGSYYLWRNKLNSFVYPLKWRDHSTTSTAKIELNYTGRVRLFITGLCFILVAIYFIIYPIY